MSDAVPARVSLLRVCIVAGVVEALSLAAGVIVQFTTNLTGWGPWLAIGALALVAALAEWLRQVLTAPRPGRVRAGFEEKIEPHRRTPAAAGLLLTVVVIGGLGFAAAAGVGYLSGFITGNESGAERLAAPVTADFDGVSVTVSSVSHTPHFTRVSVAITNGLPNTIDLPLGFCSLSVAGEQTLDADAFRSSWRASIAPQTTRQGVLVFPGHFASGPVEASLTFATVFKQGFEGPDSIAVTGLPLTALPPG
ncbi:MAG: domain containing protein [Schumannella sp.]|nr:domain containing protein [Schumannella sp.]